MGTGPSPEVPAGGAPGYEQPGDDEQPDWLAYGEGPAVGTQYEPADGVAFDAEEPAYAPDGLAYGPDELAYGPDGAGAYEDDHTSYGADELGPYDQEVPVPAGREPRRRLRLGLAIFVVVVVLAGLIGFFRVTSDINPGGHPGKLVTVVIAKGASTSAIAGDLARAGVIHGTDVFTLYVKLDSTGVLLPGTYHLATNERYARVVAALEAGPILVQRKLVVPPGYTVAQMATAVAALKGIGITRAAFLAAARDGQVSSPYLPAGQANLEGLLFPADYPVLQSESADALVQYMVETFDQTASQYDLSAAAAKLGYSPYQVVTVASIVEREAKFNVDRGPIASVIYNRLARGMPIGAESTLDYAVGKKGQTNDMLPSPYNTLIHKGLPPTPISSPGLASLQAAMHPPRTSYLYWVEINPDGKMGFASTESGFKHLQAECNKVHLGC